MTIAAEVIPQVQQRTLFQPPPLMVSTVPVV
jgi:hypothetical protein